MSRPQQPPPLAGIKVVDLTRYLAGPFCTQILGDYGAEIFKIEPVENARGELGDSGDGKRSRQLFLSLDQSIEEKYPRSRSKSPRAAKS